MSSWLFNVHMDGMVNEVKMGMGRRGMSFLEDERELRWLGLLYADDLVLCGESEEHLRVMVGQFADVEGEDWKSMQVRVSDILNGELGLEHEVHLDGTHLEHISEFKYLGSVLDESGTDGAEWNKKVVPSGP